MPSMQELPILRTIQGHKGGTTSVSFSPDGTTLASGGYDSCTRLWDVATGQEKRCFAGHRRGHVAFSPEGALLVSGGLHADAIVYDYPSLQVRHTLPNTSETWGVVFVPDGSRLAIIQPQTSIQLWDTRTWQISEQIEVDREYIYALAFAPKGHLMAFAGYENGPVHILHRNTLETVNTFAAQQSFTYGLAFSPDGAVLATTGADKMLRIWHTSDWSLYGEVQHNDAVLCASFSPDGRCIATGNQNGSICMWAFSME